MLNDNSSKAANGGLIMNNLISLLTSLFNFNLAVTQYKCGEHQVGSRLDLLWIVTFLNVSDCQLFIIYFSNTVAK